jgi:hypothetical protein
LVHKEYLVPQVLRVELGLQALKETLVFKAQPARLVYQEQRQTQVRLDPREELALLEQLAQLVIKETLGLQVSQDPLEQVLQVLQDL